MHPSINEVQELFAFIKEQFVAHPNGVPESLIRGHLMQTHPIYRVRSILNEMEHSGWIQFSPGIIGQRLVTPGAAWKH